MVASLLLLTFVGGAALWGLWAQQKEVERLVGGALPRFSQFVQVRSAVSRTEIAILRFLGYYDQDLSRARASLREAEEGLAAAAPQADLEVSAILEDIARIRAELDRIEAAEESAQLENSFATLTRLAQTTRQAVTTLSDALHDRALAEARSVVYRTHNVRGWVAAGLVLGWVVALTALVFALVRLQNPFRDILGFLRAAGEKDLTGELRVGAQDEMGVMAGAATRVSETLVNTLRAQARIAADIETHSKALLENSLEARSGAEDQVARGQAGAHKAREIEQELDPLVSLAGGLREGSEAAAASVQQILAMTEQVRGEMESLARRVVSSTESAGQLNQATARVTALATQLGGAAQAVAASATAIDDAANGLREGASEGRGLAEDVVHKAAEGRDSMADALGGMERIREAVDAAVSSFERLESELARVGTVTKVIDDIAARTNLLSLNAAIIAAQAGERGKAFNVVATEIRGLAEKTAASTREIRSIVDGVAAGGREAAQAIGAGAQRVAQGEELVRSTDDLLQGIHESADHAAGRLREIETAAGGQAAEAARVAREILQVSQGVTEIVAEVQDQEERVRRIHGALTEIEQVARQTALAADEQTRGTESITHTILEVSDVSERVDAAILRVGDLLKGLRSDLETLGGRAREELQRVASIEGEGRQLAGLAAEIHTEVESFRLPPPAPA